VIVFDDMNWTMASSAARAVDPAKIATFSPDERQARSVELLWDLLVPERGYEKVKRIDRVNWGVARKPGGRADALSVRVSDSTRRLRDRLFALARQQ
jgi:hypothetical protein